VEYKELTQVEKENELLHRIWNIKNRWDDLREEWNPIQFYRLNTSEMENKADEHHYEVSQIERDNKELKQWPLVEALKQEISVFMNTIPLIEDLKHEAMRDRHWNDLRIELKDFNLQKVMELQLLEHADRI
jgi:dynein heavy chain